MCTVSMVHDHYDDAFRKYIPGWPQMPPLSVPTTAPSSAPAPTHVFHSEQPPLAELRQLIADFRTAIAAAKTVDALTAQPDCVDPEKARMVEHIARLERIIDALTKSTPTPTGEAK